MGMIPICPVRSLRVIEGNSQPVLFGTKQTYAVIHELPVQWRQVGLTWSFVLLILACVVGGFAITIHFELGSEWGTMVLLGSGCIPFIVPAYIRFRKKRAIGFRIRTWWAETNRVGLAIVLLAICVGLAAGIFTWH